MPMLQLQGITTECPGVMRQPVTSVGRPGVCTEAYAASAGDERSKGRPSGRAHDSTGASSRPSSGAGSSRMSGSKRHREDDTLDGGDLVTGKADLMLPCLVNSLPLLAVPACHFLGISQPGDPRLAAAALSAPAPVSHAARAPLR